MHGIQFVHFVFSKTDGAELSDAKTEAKDDEESKTTDDGPVESGNQPEAFNSPRTWGINHRRRANFEISSHF